MKIRTKLLAGFSAIAVFALLAQLTTLAFFLRSRDVAADAFRRIETYNTLIHRAQQLVLAVDTEIMSSLGHAQGLSPDSANRLDQQSIRFYDLVSEMERVLPERNALHEDFQRAFMAYYLLAKQLLHQGRMEMLDKHPDILDHFRLRQVHLHAELAAAQEKLTSDSLAKLEAIENDIEGMTRNHIALSLGVLALSVLGAVVLSRRFSSPMRELLRQVESSRDTAPLDLKGFDDDEVGKLANAFSEMKHRLARREEELLLSRNLETMGRLAGGIAHEFNNLLASISTTLHALSRKNPQEARHDIDILSTLCRRGGDLGAQLLALASNRTERQDLLDPVHFLKQFEALVRKLVPDSVECRLVLEEELPQIQCSAALLHASLLNLVLNAVDAMPGGGTLTIGCFKESAASGESRVVFEVADTGHGIPRDVIPQIFDPFFTTKSPGKGAGLGLSIVDSFARRSDGNVSVRSGVSGSVFQLCLPAVTLQRDDHASSRAKRVAVLTDRPEAVDGLSRSLRASGAVLITPKAGSDLLELVQSLTPPLDLVLIDADITRVPAASLCAVIRRFFPETAVFFFGENRAALEGHDPGIPWVENWHDLPLSSTSRH